MRFALVDNNKMEAQPKLQGLCPCCSQPVIAKCGKQKIWHWAHHSKITCDNWWETETEWHRAWKKNYPTEWQEVPLLDEKTNEKHIADVRTAHNLVIEFQRSHIDPNERVSREKFYKNMVWVVDGTRLKRDYPRFLKGKKDFRKTDKQGIFLVDFLDECFPSAWLESFVPVIFDFRGLEIIEVNDVRNYLYCLFPIRIGRCAVLAEIPRKAFINTSINGDWSLRSHNFIESLILTAKASNRQPRIHIRRIKPVRYLYPRKKKRRF